MDKFWKWKQRKVINQDSTESTERVLELCGTIAEESWFADDVTPKMFKEELLSGKGDITVYINSPGGDCVAAAQIYNMLSEYPGKVTVKIDAIAASAASVIAKDKKRDPDAHSAKKGNTWHFGYKMHIGVDRDTGLVHHVKTTSANMMLQQQAN